MREPLQRRKKKRSIKVQANTIVGVSKRDGAGRGRGRQTRIWIKRNKICWIRKREEKKYMLAKDLGNWAKTVSWTTQKWRGKEYNTHNYVYKHPPTWVCHCWCIRTHAYTHTRIQLAYTHMRICVIKWKYSLNRLRSYMQARYTVKLQSKTKKEKKITKLRFGKIIVSTLTLHIPQNIHTLVIKRVCMSSREI